MRQDLGTATRFLCGVLEDRDAGVAGEKRGVSGKRVGSACAGGVGDDESVRDGVVVEEGAEFILEGLKKAWTMDY